MRDVQMPKSALIDRINENKVKHVDTYKAALETYKVRCIEVVEKMLLDVKAFKDVDKLALQRLPTPETHEDDYDVALQMLELEEREIVTLTQEEFKQYYLDEWHWQRSFYANTASYTSGV